MTSLIFVAAFTFAATNLDDFIVLLALFADPELSPGTVIAGQLVGMTLLTSTAMLLAIISWAVAGAWSHLAGILPLAIGVHRLFAQSGRGRILPAAQPQPIRKIGAVTAVTIATGGDNLVAYTPVFLGRTPSDVIAIASVFAVMTVAWCIAASTIARQRRFQRVVERFGGRLVPWTYVGLGLYVLLARTASA